MIQFKGKVKSIQEVSYRLEKNEERLIKAEREYPDSWKLREDFFLFGFDSFQLFDENNNILIQKNFYSGSYHDTRAVFKYDSNHKLTFEKFYDLSGEEKGKMVYTYNKLEAIKSIEYLDEFGKSVYKIENEYNSDNKLISSVKQDILGKIISYYNENQKINRIEIRRSDSTLKLERINVYDTTGKKTKTITLNKEGVNTQTVYYKYDDFGRLLLKEIMNNEKEKIVSRINYRYNKENKIEEEIENRLIENNPYIYRKKYKYGSHGLLIEEISYNPGSSIISILQYEYDEKKLLIETVFSTHSQPDHLISMFEYKYNFDAQVVEVIEYNDENEIISTSEKKLGAFKSILETSDIENPNHKYQPVFEYDKTGNWIKAYLYLNNELDYLIERYFEYY